MSHKKYKIIAVLLILCILPTMAYGDGEIIYTVDDVRDIIGKARLDETYTESEINQILKKYREIEKANAYARMFELGKKLDVDSEAEKQYLELEKTITTLRKQLADSYKQGKDISEVLKINTQLDAALHRISAIKQKGYAFDIEYIVNEWEDQYNRVQQNIQAMGEDYALGDLGQEMKSPVQSRFYLTSPFGFRLDPLTKAELTMHNGIDLAAYDNEPILAQWNGIVANVYYSESGGNTVEIAHGKNLVTKYLHLNKATVKIGQEVKQYQIIGLAGNTGARSTGTHLHFTVVLDGEMINPIYLYGTKGLNAFKEYLSYHPERNRELEEVETVIKDKPTKEKELEEVETPRYPRGNNTTPGAIVVPSVDVNPNPYDPKKPFNDGGVTFTEKTADELLKEIVVPAKPKEN